MRLTESKRASITAVCRSAIGEFSPELRRRAFAGAGERVVEQLVGAFGTPWTRFTLRHDPRDTLEGVRRRATGAVRPTWLLVARSRVRTHPRVVCRVVASTGKA